MIFVNFFRVCGLHDFTVSNNIQPRLLLCNAVFFFFYGIPEIKGVSKPIRLNLFLEKKSKGESF